MTEPTTIYNLGFDVFVTRGVLTLPNGQTLQSLYMRCPSSLSRRVVGLKAAHTIKQVMGLNRILWVSLSCWRVNIGAASRAASVWPIFHAYHARRPAVQADLVVFDTPGRGRSSIGRASDEARREKILTEAQAKWMFCLP